ncbi:MAG: hypothetical protein GKC01_02010 [Candidatus Methanofastidiosa archaeon]|nr:hypothetical protein [Candidatus Methanofastidiosa archaeon]
MEITSSKEKFISSLEKGDIILSRNEKSPIESIICKAVPDARWPHCRLYMGYEKSVESTVGGVQVKEVKDYLDTDDLMIVRPPDYIDKDKLVKDCMMYLGLGYSYIQFLRTGNLFLIKRLIKKDLRKYFRIDIDKNVVCCELIAYGLLEQGYQYEVTPNFCFPDQFEDDSRMKIILKYVPEIYSNIK